MLSDLEHLRSSAKKLKKAFLAGDQDAARRLRVHLPEATTPRHADCLFVIARENGHDSWPTLKFALESREMTPEQKAERLKMALYFGQEWVVRKLLDENLALPRANLGLQIATYDAKAVQIALENNPVAATELIGVRSPILHLAYSHYIHMAPEKSDDMLAVADMLLAGGANVNDGYAPDPQSQHRLSALYGALGHANNMVLARWLLRNGASPDDDESLYHATELGHHGGLKLLIEFGVSTRGTNALVRALDFDDTEAVRLLLTHGADPNEKVDGHPSGEPVPAIPALHQAARRMCSAATGKLLLEHGADATLVWQGHTAYAMARIFGNADIATLLEGAGLAQDLTITEMALAACADGNGGSASLDQAFLNAEDRKLLTQLVWQPIPLDHIRALVDAGLDPNETEDMGLTPLHVAGWEGLPEHVAYFLKLGPDLEYRNAYGGDALGTTIHGAEFCQNAAERDHIACARMLLEAGAELRTELIEGCGNEEMAQFLEGWKPD